MREELIQGILSAARNINNAAVFCKVTSSVVRNGTQADGEHFEKFV
jgi:hypothetical protein